MKRIYFKDIERWQSMVDEASNSGNVSIIARNSLSPRILPKTVEWVRDSVESYSHLGNFSEIPDDVETVVWVDRTPLFYLSYNTTIYTVPEYAENAKMYDFYKPFPNKRNILMLIEPPDGCGENYDFCSKNIDFRNRFDLILTHNKELCNTGLHKTRWYPWGTSQLDSLDDIKVYPKTKLCSFNYSNKKWWPGHKFRYNLGNSLISNAKVDVMGPFDYRNYIPKLNTVKNYYFSIQVENQKVDDFFSDKIIDCFLTGCIPIYRGTNNIGNYFNTDGIIQFNTEQELTDIINSLTPELYYSKYNSVLNNFVRAQNYINPEDWILSTYGSEVFK